jgi:hypothetical protein
MIAQVIPVVMLALVVEGRYMARQLSRKRDFRSNSPIRVTYAVIFLANCFALFFGFFLATRGAGGVELQRWQIAVADSSVNFGVATVFLSPALGIIYALLGDKVVEVHRQMPYSKAARDRRAKRRRLEVLDALQREYQVFRLEARSDIADLYIRAYQLFRESGNSGSDESELEEALAEIDELAALFGAKLVNTDERIAAAVEAHEARDELMSEIEREAFRAQLRLTAGR